ncbi:thioredoxin family protein [Flavivirga algicola]|uniref:Thioredoxin family protein n=1 Tax=Flavivirga algicola TaxID=2729136 RepID=A0ABX1RXV3_9FLAO|nr:thioredoxin family protein [Flavivirga algicola]NMH88406.1 thioredoxin family protein [Flavivirga algicola]
MKKIIFIVILLFTSLSFSQEWETNLNKAKSLAKEKNQNIVLVFSGSDWCAPCIKLEREVFDTNTFKAYSKDNFVMLKADFPRRKKNALPKTQETHNKQLAERYNSKGYFPLVVVLNEKGNVLKELGYVKTTPQGFIDLINN